MTTTPAMPERFTKKPVTIEAVQFTEALRDAIVLDGAPCPEGVERGATTWHQKYRKIWRAEFFIYTLEGRMNVEIGDWIIKGVKGEFYPCKPDIFEMTYDRAALQAQPAEVGVSDVIAMVRERYRGTKWGKAAECICDAVDEAILALRPQAVPMTEGWQEVAACPDGDVWFSLSCGHVVMGWKQGPLLLDWEAAVDHDCCSDASAIKAMPVTPPAHHGITAPAGWEG